jgi:hypothetical protein
MYYTDYLKKRFKIDEFDYNTTQFIFEKEYIIWNNENTYISYYDGCFKLPFEAILKHIEKEKEKEKTIMYNGIAIILCQKYTLNLRRNNIGRIEMFYILYILDARFSMKLSKKDLKQFFKTIR